MPAARHLQILLAPDGSAATAAVLPIYRQALGGDPPLDSRAAATAAGRLAAQPRALWLAPSLAAAASARDALVAGPDDAYLDPGVATFADFAAEAMWASGRRFRRLLPLERRHALRRIIAEAAADGALQFFGKVTQSVGLLNLVEEAIAGLKRRGISAAAYEASHRTLPRECELATLYTRYERRLAAGHLLDDEGLLLAGREALRDLPDVTAAIGLVVVDGFSDFTSAQADILAILAARAERVVVTLTADAAVDDSGSKVKPRIELFAKTLATRDALRAWGGVEVDLATLAGGGPPLRAAAAACSPALAHLQRNLFRDYADFELLSPAAAAALDDVEITAASSVQGELEAIARRVKRLLLDGTPPSEIVVAFPSTRDVADRLRIICDDYGIPAHFDAPRRLAEAPRVRTLLNVLRLHAEDWPYRPLLQVVGDRSLGIFDGAPNATEWPSASREARLLAARAAVERCVRHAQVPAGKAALLEQIAAWAADESGLAAVDRATAAHAGKTLQLLAAALDELPAHGTLDAWLLAVERMTTRLALSPSEDDEALTAAAMEALVRGVRAVAHTDASLGVETPELAAGEFAALVATIAGELPSPDQRDAVGRVRIVSAASARFTRPRHLLVGALSEQSYAAADRTDSWALGEDARAQAAGAAGDEMLLFYQLVTRPTETLSLSYPALDAKAQVMMPSPFLVELRRCFADRVRTTVQPLAYASQFEETPLGRGELRRTAVAAARHGEPALLASLARSPRFGPTGRSMLYGVETVASRGDRRAFGAYEGVFAADGVRAVLERKYGADHLWSPSKLELYAACPFRFFGEQVLGLAPAPELVLESDLARRGSVLHETLARLYARLSAALAAGEQAPTPELVAERFQETLDAIVQTRPRRGIDGVMREIERRQIASWARDFAAQHDAYAAAWSGFDVSPTPTYFEARFGPRHRRNVSEDNEKLSTESPLELVVGDEPIRFTGQIDRIDVGRVGETAVFNVIDYKTGAGAKVNLDRVRAGTQLQLPLYAIAAAELLLADQQAAALAAGYWSIRGNGFNAAARSGGPLLIGEIRDGRVEMAAHWTSLRESLLARIGEIVTGIRAGHFPVFSDDKDCGKYCPLKTGCRVNHVRSLEKVWPSPATASP